MINDIFDEHDHDGNVMQIEVELKQYSSACSYILTPISSVN